MTVDLSGADDGQGFKDALSFNEINQALDEAGIETEVDFIQWVDTDPAEGLPADSLLLNNMFVT